MSTEKNNHQPQSFLNFIIALLKLDIVEIIVTLAKVSQHLNHFLPQQPGIYEVLEYNSQLELKDSKGKTAIYHKHQKVKFLQNNVVAYQDQAWGDGDIFADYKCSPGKPVDRYREGHRYRILISLRGSKDRGDIEDFRIQRTIIDGFTSEVEDYQVEIDHKTHRLKLEIIFPKSRLPKQVSLIEQNASNTTILNDEHLKFLPDGRQSVRWETNRPRLFEAYIMRWTW